MTEQTTQAGASNTDALINHELAYIEALEGEKYHLEIMVNKVEEVDWGDIDWDKANDSPKDHYIRKQRILDIDAEIAIKQEYVLQLRSRIDEEQKFREETLANYHENFDQMVSRALILYGADDKTVGELKALQSKHLSGQLSDEDKVNAYLQLQQLLAQKEQQNG